MTETIGCPILLARLWREGGPHALSHPVVIPSGALAQFAGAESRDLLFVAPGC